MALELLELLDIYDPTLAWFGQTGFCCCFYFLFGQFFCLLIPLAILVFSVLPEYLIRLFSFFLWCRFVLPTEYSFSHILKTLVKSALCFFSFKNTFLRKTLKYTKRGISSTATHLWTVVSRLQFPFSSSLCAVVSAFNIFSQISDFVSFLNTLVYYL